MVLWILKPGSRRVAGYVVFIAVVLLVFLVARLYLAEVPVAVVKGNSMYPLLREGDVVFIARVNPGDVRIGDVIVFTVPGGRLVVHRVVEIVEIHGERFFITQGDYNPIRDFYYPVGVPEDKVVGRLLTLNNAVFKVPYIGNIALIFKR